MARFYDAKAGVLEQLHRRFNAAGMTDEEVSAVGSTDGLAELMLVALRADERAQLVHGLFTPPDRQIAYLKRVNAERGWGFSDADFASLSAPPAFTDNTLVAVVLVPRLADKDGVGGLQRTFDEVYAAAGSRQHACWRWERLLSDPAHLRLWGGHTHVHGLSWARLDLGANRGRSSKDVRDEFGEGTRLPEAELLSCALMHPHWVRAMGSDVPFVDAAGYEVTVSGGDPWRSVPYMRFSRGDRKLELNALHCVSRGDGWGVPVFVRE